MSIYTQRGVSAQKEEVHAATVNIDKGLFPYAFCKIYSDLLGGDESWVNLMHADGAGTKSVLAYLYWKETGDVSVWKGIAQDALVMNLDDLLCAGIHNNILFSSSIDRNKALIPGEVLKAIIEGTQEFIDRMEGHDVMIAFLGGETADVGDVVRTIAVNGTMSARWRKDKLITNEKIHPGNVIVGLASYGKAGYESFYNSGIGSNGLTSARHDVLDKSYQERFPESFDPSLQQEVVYVGRHRLTDEVHDAGQNKKVSVGSLVLSPTRTYAPVLQKIFKENFDAIHGLIHCSGGGQTKCMKYMQENVKIIKDQLFEPPLIFQLIQESSGASIREMYEVFNMGCRMEIYTTEKNADQVISMAKSFNIEAKVIGRVSTASQKQLALHVGGTELIYG